MCYHCLIVEQLSARDDCLFLEIIVSQSRWIRSVDGTKRKIILSKRDCICYCVNFLNARIFLQSSNNITRIGTTAHGKNRMLLQSIPVG